MSLFFPVCTRHELPHSRYIPLSSLIAGESAGLFVPVYSVMECPEVARIRVADYIAGKDGVIPVYSNAGFMTTKARPVSAITATPS